MGMLSSDVLVGEANVGGVMGDAPAFMASVGDVVALLHALGPAMLAPVRAMGGHRGVVALSAADAQVTASAWSREAFVQVTIPARVSSPGCVVVDLKDFADHLCASTGISVRSRVAPARVREDVVCVERGEAGRGGGVRVEVGGHRCLLAHEGARWSGMPDLVRVGECVEVSTAELAGAVTRVAASADTPGSLPTLTAMRVRVGAGRVHLLATDRYRLATELATELVGAAGQRASSGSLVPAGSPAADAIDAQDYVQVDPRAVELPRLVKALPAQRVQVAAMIEVVPDAAPAPTPDATPGPMTGEMTGAMTGVRAGAGAFGGSTGALDASTWLSLSSGPVVILVPGLDVDYPRVEGILEPVRPHRITVRRQDLMAAIDASVPVLTTGAHAMAAAPTDAGQPDAQLASKVARSLMNSAMVRLIPDGLGVRVEPALDHMAEVYASHPSVTPDSTRAGVRTDTPAWRQAHERALASVADATDREANPEGSQRHVSAVVDPAMADVESAWSLRRLTRALASFATPYVVMHSCGEGGRPLMITGTNAATGAGEVVEGSYTLIIMPIRARAQR